jgi:hypothetical protein
VTQDSDFLKLASEGVPHNGLAYYLPGSRSIGELISTLVLMSELLTSEECPGLVEFL